MRNQIVLARSGGDADAPGPFRRAFHRLRLRLRLTTSLERVAARNRAERLFEVNFRSPWTR